MNIETMNIIEHFSLECWKVMFQNQIPYEDPGLYREH